MNGRRPLGVSLLAIHHYTGVIWAAILSIGVIAFPGRLHLSPDTTFWTRVLWSVLVLFLGWLFYLWARGLWRLRNWARRLEIGLASLILIPVKGFSEISPVLLLFQAGADPRNSGTHVDSNYLVLLVQPWRKTSFRCESNQLTLAGCRRHFVLRFGWFCALQVRTGTHGLSMASTTRR
jgi:hypothetical protein